MPGICGIISKVPAEENKEKLNIMHQCMLHESFYSAGTFTEEKVGLYAGWVCHEGSFSDCMPVMNEKKDLVLIFFGENFADPELFDNLKSKNHSFDRSNADYLIHLYEEEGEGFFQNLNGWYCGILIDFNQGKIILFNDRYGMQRIYYYEVKDSLYFSSEAKSLLRIFPETREIDERGLAEYICCNCVLEYRTLFKNIFLLPFSSLWTVDNSFKINKKQYFNPVSWENQSWLEKDFFYEKLNSTFRKMLPRYFRSNQKIGISLTGGLDTRMIMSNIDLAPGKHPCYTFGSIYRDCNDVKVARKVAEVCEQTHQVVSLGDGFLSEFPKYAEKTIYITDGCLDTSGSPEVYVNGLAREIAPVRITGNQGSEVFRNMRWMKAFYPYKNLYSQELVEQFNYAIETYKKISSGHPLTFTLFKDSPWHEYRTFSSEQSQITLRTPYMDKDLVSLMYRSPPELRTNKTVSLRMIADGNPLLRKIPTDRGAGGDNHKALSILLRAYHETMFRCEYYYNYGMPQWLAAFDYMLKPLHIEKFFLGRHKFYHFRVWYRDQLSEYVREILLDEKTLKRPYLKRDFLEHIVNSHTAGYRNYTTEITKMLTIELIQRLLIENH